MSVYVGIDVYRERSQVAVVAEDGKVQLNRNVVNGQEPMLRLIGGLPTGTPVAFESAYGWGWLVALLEDYGFDLHMVHPLRCKAIASARLRWVLNQAAQTAERSPEFAASYAAITKRRGKKIATIAIARNLLTRAYQLLAGRRDTWHGDTTHQHGSLTARMPPRPGGSPTPGAPATRHEPAREGQAALDHMTEQPGPRTHGHGVRQNAGGTPDGCLRDHSASHTGTTTRPSKNQHSLGSFPASDDPSPLVGLKLVRPRRYAAAGAPA